MNLAAFLLACATAVLLTATAASIGLTWDEAAYITAADSYTAWFETLARNPAGALDAETLGSHWVVNHAHPPVAKVLSGLVSSAARSFTDELTAHRLGSMLAVAALVALLYLSVAGTYGNPAGLFAAASLVLMPRFFFHAHLVALDIPVAVASFAVTFLFWKTVDRKGLVWGLWLGVAWGLAAATKTNGALAPLAPVIWSLFFRRNRAVALRLLLMGPVALLTFFLAWPWLYRQTWARTLEYINFQLHHDQIGQWYLGGYHVPPPWHFAFLILWAVVPLTVMTLALTGMARAGTGKRDGGFAWLLLLSVFASLLPFIFGKGLVYDNDRLFMPVFPFLAALAGVGFHWLAACLEKLLQRIKRPALKSPSVAMLGIALLVPQSVAMTRLYPHLLSYYSEGVGGLRGATRLGLETTYWCETYAAALPYLNEHAKHGDAIWVEPLSYDVLIYYQTIGRLRPDLQILSPYPAQSALGPRAPQPVTGIFTSADWYILQYRQSQYGPDGEQGYVPRRILEAGKPRFEVIRQGVPLMRLYGALQ